MVSVWKDYEKINYVASVQSSLGRQKGLSSEGFRVDVFSSKNTQDVKYTHIPLRNRDRSTCLT